MIGVFDSGFGGLTIFKDIEKELPNYDYIYLGDNARTPYGNHSQEVIYEYTKQAVQYLFKQGCDLIILACNTASSEALRKIQEEYIDNKDKNILGVIRPLIEEASELTKNKVIGIMGTKSTVNSKAYINELKEKYAGINIIQEACPLLVLLVEENLENSVEANMILKRYIKPLKSNNPDIIILGCTHYGFLQNKIQNYFGKNIKVLESGKIIAKKLKEYLDNHKNLVKESKNKKRIFLTTDSNITFDKAATKFLGRDIKSKTINLN